MKTPTVKTLEDLHGRCRIDPYTSCWNWAWAMSKGKSKTLTPKVYLTPDVLGLDRATVLPANRAAWILAGKKVDPSLVIYRTCVNTACINPKHLAQGTKGQMHQHYSASGKNRGNPMRALINTKSRSVQLVPRERVQLAEAMFADGKSSKEVRQALRMCGHTVKMIREGRHANSSNAGPRLMPGASVFSMGAST